MAEGEPEKKGGLTRREWLRLSVAAGAGAAVGVLGGYEVSRLLGPPTTVEVGARDTIYYQSVSNPQSIASTTPIGVSDLREWQGAAGLWRAVFVTTPEGSSYLAGSGLPVSVIRVKRDDAIFSSPSPTEIDLPPGFGLFYDDSVRDIRIVVVYERCTHLCCYARWHVDPVLVRDYVARTPTYEVYGQDPIYCACHDAQFDPMVLVKDMHPNGVSYVGAQWVRGPAKRALPVVPVRAEADVLIGGMADPRWYASYCK